MADLPARKSVLRSFLLLLIGLNLVALGVRLWPWSSVFELPGNGTTGIDPTVTLLVYIALAFWIGSARGAISRRVLSWSSFAGILAGLLLVAQLYLNSQATDTRARSILQYGLTGATVVVWGVCGTRAMTSGCAKGFAAVSAIWAALFSSSIASFALLGGSFFALSPGQTSDTWKQYQGLAIGSDQMQGLVRTLLAATGYLLVVPLVACAAGAIFGALAKPPEGKK